MGRSVALLSIVAAVAAKSLCPCSNPDLCKPLPASNKSEVYAFSISTTNWPYYPWSSGLLTHVCAFQGLDPSMVCTAHENGVKVTTSAAYPKVQLHNSTFLKEFINQQITFCSEYALDGFNFDFEDPITSTSDAQALVNVMNQTSMAMKAALGSEFQITADLAWSPHCIDQRCYDNTGIAEAVDLVFLMEYDLRSQVWPPNPCIAGSNDAFPDVQAGVQGYLSLGIPANKMMLGVPFYGFDYTCVGNVGPTDSFCPIDKVPFEGAPCSDAAGDPTDYQILIPYVLDQSSTGRQWNATTKTPWFNYVDVSGVTHQVVYDDPESLSLKFEYARALGMAGVGMWNIDSLDWTSTDPQIRNLTNTMYNTIAVFINGTVTAASPIAYE